MKKVLEKGILRSIIYVIASPTCQIIKLLYIKILKKIKIDEKLIIFTSKPNYSDNSKYLYKYYKEKYKNEQYKYIWLVDRDFKGELQNNKTRFVKFNSNYHKGYTFKSLYYLSKAKYIFFTHRSPYQEINKKYNQIVINLWHGCGYKNIEKMEKSWSQKNPFDYALVPGNVFVETKSKFWDCPKEKILNIGYPRYDLLLKDNNSAKKFGDKIKKNNSKLIIWMPTFRKTKSGGFPEEKNRMDYDLPLLKSDNEVNELNKICKDNNIVLCIKRHPFQLKYLCEKIELSNIYFIDNDVLNKEEVELYSLLKYTDALITDYSSIAIDYLLLNKPIAFTLNDYEEYKKTRGFVFENPKKYMPGHHIYNFEDIKKYIEDIGNSKDLFKEDRQIIMNEVHNSCDNYCERIVNEIEKIMEVK